MTTLLESHVKLHSADGCQKLKQAAARSPFSHQFVRAVILQAQTIVSAAFFRTLLWAVQRKFPYLKIHWTVWFRNFTQPSIGSDQSVVLWHATKQITRNFFLKSKYQEKTLNRIFLYNLCLPNDEYAQIKYYAYVLISVFGSTYLCKIHRLKILLQGLPWWFSGEDSTLPTQGPGFNPCSGN